MRTAHTLLAVALLSAFTPINSPAQQSSQPPAAPLSQTTPAATPATEVPDAPQATAQTALQPTGPTAVFDTSMGRISCKLYDKEAPVTVANFIGLAEGAKDWTDPITHKKMHNKPYYNGTTFHRVIPDFMIQGGDPLATGEGDPGYMFNDEVNSNLNFDVPGRLAMANAGPNTNGSQFFITEAPVDQLDQHYNLFGQCDPSSVLVVKMIARVQRDPQDKPVEPVVLNKVTIVRSGQSMPPAPTPAATAKPASQP